ncbi:MAG: nitrile hydratase subunit beta [Alphaproteobacteria bacterium]
MDGIHDLGGRQGFGLIDVDEPEQPFHHPWEARLLGLVRAMGRPGDWSIDWFRHCRELIDPVDYLTRPYYDQWLQTYAAMMVKSGVATVAEIAAGTGKPSAVPTSPPMKPADVDSAKRAVVRFDRDSRAAAAFKVGDAVRAKGHGASGHTRLPAYVRGRRGDIVAYHGAHVLPDANALGEATAEPLYTVAFAAAELWPEAAGRRDSVRLDLWQSYLDRP